MDCESNVVVPGSGMSGLIRGDDEMRELWNIENDVMVSVYPQSARAQVFMDDVLMTPAGENLFRAPATQREEAEIRVVAEGFEERRERIRPVEGKPENLDVRLVPPMHLEFWLEDAETGAVIGNRGVVRSRRSYRFLLRTNRDVYLYIFNIGSTGKIVVLAPNPKLRRDNFVRAGELVRIPKQMAFPLDENPGPEKIIAVASPAPLPDCQRLGEAVYANAAYRLNEDFHQIVASLGKTFVTKDFLASPVEPAASRSITLDENDGLVIEFEYVHK